VFTADPPDLREAKRRHRDRFSEAVEAALGGRAEDAAARFDELASIVPEDGPVQWWRVQAAAELSESASTVRGGALHMRAKV